MGYLLEELEPETMLAALLIVTNKPILQKQHQSFK
jgi:hypothetical protein